MDYYPFKTSQFKLCNQIQYLDKLRFFYYMVLHKESSNKKYRTPRSDTISSLEALFFISSFLKACLFGGSIFIASTPLFINFIYFCLIKKNSLAPGWVNTKIGFWLAWSPIIILFVSKALVVFDELSSGTYLGTTTYYFN